MEEEIKQKQEEWDRERQKFAEENPELAAQMDEQELVKIIIPTQIWQNILLKSLDNTITNKVITISNTVLFIHMWSEQLIWTNKTSPKGVLMIISLKNKV